MISQKVSTKSLEINQSEKLSDQETGILAKEKIRPIMYKQAIIENSRHLKQKLVKRVTCHKWIVQPESHIHMVSSDFRKFGIMIKRCKTTEKLCLKLPSTQSIRHLRQKLKTLTNVKDISLTLDSDFKTQELKTVCQDVKKLKFLKFMHADLYNLLIIDRDMYSLKQSLAKLKSLQGLTLDLPLEISEKGVYSLLETLKRLPKFGNLALGRCGYSFQDSGLPKINQGLRLLNLKNLEINLYMWFQTTQEGRENFIQNLTDLTSLQSLKISSLRLLNVHDRTITGFSERSEKLSSLKDLKLHLLGNPGEHLNDEFMKSLANDLTRLPILTSLSLDSFSFKNITDDGMNALKEVFRKHSSLTYFSARFYNCTQVSDQGFCSIIEGLEMGNVPLQELSLKFQETKITDEWLAFFISKSKIFSSLKILEMEFDSCSEITDKQFNSLLTSLKELANLEVVILNFMRCKVDEKQHRKLEREIKEAFPLSSTKAIEFSMSKHLR